MIHLIESDLLELNPDNKFGVCLLGDFNLHTNNNSDFILIDENTEQTLHIENPDDSLGRITIGELGFPVGRFNSDNSQVDNYGQRLLETYQSYNLYIASGRLGGDRFLG